MNPFSGVTLGVLQLHHARPIAQAPILKSGPARYNNGLPRQGYATLPRLRKARCRPVSGRGAAQRSNRLISADKQVHP